MYSFQCETIWRTFSKKSKIFPISRNIIHDPPWLMEAMPWLWNGSQHSVPWLMDESWMTHGLRSWEHGSTTARSFRTQGGNFNLFSTHEKKLILATFTHQYFATWDEKKKKIHAAISLHYTLGTAILHDEQSGNEVVNDYAINLNESFQKKKLLQPCLCLTSHQH